MSHVFKPGDLIRRSGGSHKGEYATVIRLEDLDTGRFARIKFITGTLSGTVGIYPVSMKFWDLVTPTDSQDQTP